MSLRVRLALVAGAAVAAAVVVASVVVYFVVRNELFGPINSGLQGAVTSIRLPPDTVAVPISGGHRPNEFILAGFGLDRSAGFLPFRLVEATASRLPAERHHARAACRHGP